MVSQHAGHFLRANEGESLWFLNTLMTVKVDGSATGGAFTLLEQLAPAGFETPLHLHHSEDEAFYILDGDLRVTCGDDAWDVGPGDLVFLPRGVPHGFRVSGAGRSRLLQITAPSQFERFLRDVGQPASAPTLPPPSQPDFEKLVATMGRYKIELAGPPPSP
jgi:mannose-6-phosphate isomerase-like protein (cupin superfamily)